MVLVIAMITMSTNISGILTHYGNPRCSRRPHRLDHDDDNHNLGGVHRAEPGRPLSVARDWGGRHLRHAFRLEEIAHTCHCAREVKLR